MMQYLHATSVNVEGQGVLIRGPSGCGKSDLALRLIDAGAMLIADDQTKVVKGENAVILSVPDTIAGKIEIRGFGISKLPYNDKVQLALIVDLRQRDEIERMPEIQKIDICEMMFPVMQLNGFEASAVAKIHAVLKGLSL